MIPPRSLLDLTLRVRLVLILVLIGFLTLMARLLPIAFLLVLLTHWTFSLHRIVRMAQQQRTIRLIGFLYRGKSRHPASGQGPDPYGPVRQSGRISFCAAQSILSNGAGCCLINRRKVSQLIGAFVMTAHGGAAEQDHRENFAKQSSSKRSMKVHSCKEAHCRAISHQKAPHEWTVKAGPRCRKVTQTEARPPNIEESYQAI